MTYDMVAVGTDDSAILCFSSVRGAHINSNSAHTNWQGEGKIIYALLPYSDTASYYLCGSVEVQPTGLAGLPRQHHNFVPNKLLRQKKFLRKEFYDESAAPKGKHLVKDFLA
jgi:hypothetical protein